MIAKRKHQPMSDRTLYDCPFGPIHEFDNGRVILWRPRPVSDEQGGVVGRTPCGFKNMKELEEVIDE